MSYDLCNALVGNTKPATRRPYGPTRVSPDNVGHALNDGFSMSYDLQPCQSRSYWFRPTSYSVVELTHRNTYSEVSKTLFESADS